MNGQAAEMFKRSIGGTTTRSGLPTSQTQLIDPNSVHEVRLGAAKAGAACHCCGGGRDDEGDQQYPTPFVRRDSVQPRGRYREIRTELANFDAPHLMGGEFSGSIGGLIVLPLIHARE